MDTNLRINTGNAVTAISTLVQISKLVDNGCL